MIKLTCPQCKHEWNYRGNCYRAQCKECGKMFKTGIQKQKKQLASTEIANSVMSGEIIKAIKKVGIDPKRSCGDNIPIILQDEKLEFVLAKASRNLHTSPEKIIRKALRTWLVEKGYYDD